MTGVRTSLFLGLLAAVVSLTPAADSLTSLESSDTCGECHEDIYDMWRASAHARSMENSRFLAFNMDHSRFMRITILAAYVRLNLKTRFPDWASEP